jgi:hypothetical protein
LDDEKIKTPELLRTKHFSGFIFLCNNNCIEKIKLFAENFHVVAGCCKPENV